VVTDVLAIMHNGIIKAVKSKKHKEIPSSPKDRFKLYSSLKGSLYQNWNPNRDLSKWYQNCKLNKKNDIVVVFAIQRISTTYCFGMKLIIEIKKLK